jgi:hypothetical protein
MSAAVGLCLQVRLVVQLRRGTRLGQYSVALGQMSTGSKVSSERHWYIFCIRVTTLLAERCSVYRNASKALPPATIAAFKESRVNAGFYGSRARKSDLDRAAGVPGEVPTMLPRPHAVDVAEKY